MAFSQADIDSIDIALATGDLSVRFPDGRQIEYRSVDDLIKAKRAIEAQINAASTSRLSPRYQQADFSDG